MNEDEEVELDASRSLCWNCKYGLCVQEVEGQTMLHDPPDILQQPKIVDPFGAPDFEEVKDEETEQPVLHYVTVRRIQAICYWRPPNIEGTPIRVSEVSQCNRFEKK